MKMLQTTRERADRHALKGNLKKKLAAYFDKVSHAIFYGESFESFMDALTIVCGLYIVIHIIIAWARGWL